MGVAFLSTQPLAPGVCKPKGEGRVFSLHWARHLRAEAAYTVGLYRLLSSVIVNLNRVCFSEAWSDKWTSLLNKLTEFLLHLTSSDVKSGAEHAPQTFLERLCALGP